MTSSENEREDITEGGIETWRETVARNRLERRQRGSNYQPRHRREPAGHGWQTITGHTYDSTTERPRRPSSGDGASPDTLARGPCSPRGKRAGPLNPARYATVP